MSSPLPTVGGAFRTAKFQVVEIIVRGMLHAGTADWCPIQCENSELANG